MNIYRLISTSICVIMTLFISAMSYIYVVNGLKCATALGLCSVAINIVLIYNIYRIVLSIYEGKDISRCSDHKAQKKYCTNTERQTTDKKLIRGENGNLHADTEKEQNDNHELAISECKAYMEKVVSPFFSETIKSDLLKLVDDYANGVIRCTPIVIGINDTKGLRPIDFFHLVWNLWTRLNTLDRRASCRFIKLRLSLNIKRLSMK